MSFAWLLSFYYYIWKCQRASDLPLNESNQRSLTIGSFTSAWLKDLVVAHVLEEIYEDKDLLEKINNIL